MIIFLQFVNYSRPNSRTRMEQRVFNDLRMETAFAAPLATQPLASSKAEKFFVKSTNHRPRLHPVAMAKLFGLLALARHAIAASELTVQFRDTAVNLSVLVDDVEWFRSEAFMVSEGGRSFSVMNGTLSAKSTQNVSGTDMWGTFTGLESTFVAKGINMWS